MRTLRRCAASLVRIALAAVLAAPSAEAAKPVTPGPGPTALACRADPVKRFAIGQDETRFGALAFLDGIEVSCSGGLFGGISGLALAPDGLGFVMVSDAGLWITGRLVERDGRLAGLADVAAGPMLGGDGQPLAATDDGDTESLGMAGGVAIVGIEESNEVVAFDFARDGILARARRIATPPEVGDLPSNRGFEALGIAPAPLPIAGAVVAISERSSETGPTTVGFLIGGPSPGRFEVLRTHGYDVTDLAFLPDGDMVVLERRYSLIRGVAVRLRRIAGASIKPGAVLDGPVLMEADRGDRQVDNMEALAISRDRDGRTILTLASDDNYSYFQRSLILRFVLDELD